MKHIERPVEYWREMYLLHSESMVFKKRVHIALEKISEFLSIGAKSYVSLSGGKDSTALAHLVSRVNDKIWLVSQKDDFDFPGEKEHVHEIAIRCGSPIHIIEPDFSMWDLAKEIDFTEDVHSQNTEFSKVSFYDPLKKFQESNNYKGVFLGLRAEESKGREWNVKAKGQIYYNAGWEQLVYQPLAHWTGQDVMAYLFKYDLPILPVYFQTKFVGSPEKVRKSWVIPSGQSSSGQALWLKHYYPEIFAKLSMINPKMRAYV